MNLYVVTKRSTKTQQTKNQLTFASKRFRSRKVKFWPQNMFNCIFLNTATVLCDLSLKKTRQQVDQKGKKSKLNKTCFFFRKKNFQRHESH